MTASVTVNVTVTVLRAALAYPDLKVHWLTKLGQLSARSTVSLPFCLSVCVCGLYWHFVEATPLCNSCFNSPPPPLPTQFPLLPLSPFSPFDCFVNVCFGSFCYAPQVEMWRKGKCGNPCETPSRFIVTSERFGHMTSALLSANRSTLLIFQSQLDSNKKNTPWLPKRNTWHKKQMKIKTKKKNSRKRQPTDLARSKCIK